MCRPWTVAAGAGEVLYPRAGRALTYRRRRAAVSHEIRRRCGRRGAECGRPRRVRVPAGRPPERRVAGKPPDSTASAAAGSPCSPPGSSSALVGYLADLYPPWLGLVAIAPVRRSGRPVRRLPPADRPGRAGRPVLRTGAGPARGEVGRRRGGRRPVRRPGPPVRRGPRPVRPGVAVPAAERRPDRGRGGPARRLAEAAGVGREVLARQAAVADLRPRLDLREALAVAGADVPHGVPFADLAAWGAAPAEPIPPVAAGGGVRPRRAELRHPARLARRRHRPAAVPGQLSRVARRWRVPLFGWARRVLAPVEKTAAHLALLETILARLEAERFEAPRLVELQASLNAGGERPSVQLRGLRALTDWYDARRNAVFLPLRVLLVVGRADGVPLRGLAAAVRPGGRPVARRGGRRRGPVRPGRVLLREPRRPVSRIDRRRDASPPTGWPTRCCRPAAVRNDVALGGAGRLLVVSGSNMSGKSTLLRAVGANAVLALAGGPVRATAVETVAAGGRGDDAGAGLAAGRPVAVLRRGDAGAGDPRPGRRAVPVLFLLDELFAGTNSADRLRGAEGVIRALLGRAARSGW